jgi:hypothetical protein
LRENRKKEKGDEVSLCFFLVEHWNNKSKSDHTFHCHDYNIITLI